MDFTRQPLIESVITAKEGCKLVVRSSKGTGQEEYFVDAVEVVSFGNSFFFRSQEKPKSFLVPATDYEILEVREARMVLKNVGVDRSIKIAGGKEQPQKQGKSQPEKEVKEEQTSRQTERKRDRRRSFRRRKRGDEGQEQNTPVETNLIPPPPMSEKAVEAPEPQVSEKPVRLEGVDLPTSGPGSLLPPPPNLISDTIEKYKDNKLFEGVFLKQERKVEPVEEHAEEEKVEVPNEDPSPSEVEDEKPELEVADLFYMNPEESFQGRTNMFFQEASQEPETANEVVEEVKEEAPAEDIQEPVSESEEETKRCCDTSEVEVSPSDAKE
ncbi:MAG: hypothetical protein VX777_06525 [Chlamydiota bacterium]|nr:hypothetical protein [Chlamydiota bacterium]